MAKTKDKPKEDLRNATGVDFQVGVKESESINQLDAQKETGRSIYGKGYIVGEKAAAEKAAAEKARATHWELSAREKEIINRLSRNKK